MVEENTHSNCSVISTRVPRPSHYSADYLGTDLVRLCSYREQVRYAVRSNPATALLVGKGDGIVQDLLERAGIDVTTLDIQPELKPDVVGSVDAMPLPAKSYDVALCCQVLEHLPFERFVPAIRELARVARYRLIVSLPDVRRFISMKAQVSKIKVNWQLSLPHVPSREMPKARLEMHGHYWEIGFRGSTFNDVCRAIDMGGCRIIESRRVSDLSWHTFIYAAPHDIVTSSSSSSCE